MSSMAASAPVPGPWETTPRGIEVLKEELHLPRKPSYVGEPSEYARAWLDVSNDPPRLRVTGDALTDRALEASYWNYHHLKSLIYNLNEREVMLKELHSKVDPLADKIYALAKKHKEAHHEVTMRSRALKLTQEAALNAINHCTPDNLETETIQQQHVVALSTKLMVEAGIIYADLSIQWKKNKPIYDKQVAQLGVLRERHNLDEATLIEVIIPRYQLKTEKIEAIFEAMVAEKGLNASEWGINGNVTAIVGPLLANLARSLDELRRGIVVRLRQALAATVRPR